MNANTQKRDGMPGAELRIRRLVAEIRDTLDEIIEAEADTFCPQHPISGEEVARQLRELARQLQCVFSGENDPCWPRDSSGVYHLLLTDLEELHDLTASYHRLGSTWIDIEGRFCRIATRLRLLEPAIDGRSTPQRTPSVPEP